MAPPLPRKANVETFSKTDLLQKRDGTDVKEI